MALWCVFLTFVDFILKKVITFVWKKMRCWFVLIPNFFGAELSFSTVPKCLGAELSFSTGTEMSWCRTVLFLFGVATLLKEFFHYVVTTRLIGNRNTQTVIQTWLRNPMPWKPEHLRWVMTKKPYALETWTLEVSYMPQTDVSGVGLVVRSQTTITTR